MIHQTERAPAEDAREEVQGEETKLRAALKPFANAYAPEAERVARFYTPDDLAKYGEAFDRNTVTPAVTMGDFRRAYEAFNGAASTPAVPGTGREKTCTCPSGDGSLRWPCPVHPLEAKAGEDA